MYKRLVLFIMLDFISCMVIAQSFDRKKYSVVLPLPNSTSYMVGIGGNPKDGDFKNIKWGFVDENGNIVLPIVYEQIGGFVSDFAVVKRNGKYGFINRDYKLVIPCEFTAVGGFNELGLVWVNQGGKFDEATPDLIVGGLFGVYDSNGNVVIPVKYKAIGTFDRKPSKHGKPFENFTAIPDAFKDMERAAGVFNVHSYSYIDARMYTPMELPWDNNIVVSTTGLHIRDGICDASGKQLLPPDKFDLLFAPSEGIVPVARYNSGALQANYYKLESNGLMFTNWVTVDCITPFVGGIAIMTVHDKNTFITNTGQKVGTPYNIILPSESDYYVVSQNDKYGLVQSNGTMVIPCEYAVIFPMKEERMLFCKEKGGKCGYIDINGQIIIDPIYDKGTSFHNGCAMVKSNGSWGMIDRMGNKVVSCSFFSIIPPSEEHPARVWARKEKGGKCICIDTRSDSLAFTPSYQKVFNFNEHYDNVAFVGSADGQYGCIDTCGLPIIPVVMKDISLAFNKYAAMLKDGKKRWDATDLWRWNLRVKQSNILYPITTIIPEEEWDY